MKKRQTFVDEKNWDRRDSLSKSLPLFIINGDDFNKNVRCQVQVQELGILGNRDKRTYSFGKCFLHLNATL